MQLILSLLILALLAWQVRRWLRRSEEKGFVAGWDACAKAERARAREPRTMEVAIDEWLAEQRHAAVQE